MEGEEVAPVIRSTRDEKPVHYSLKIQSFSLLKDAIAKTEDGRYESPEFDAVGYKWKLAFYPNGDKRRNESQHISLYLVTTENDILSSTSEVNVIFTFLVYDHFKDKYLTFQDGKVRRFHALKTEWGFPQFLKLSTFNAVLNGLLFDDWCVFGVEIFVMKSDGKKEVISFIKEPKNNKYTWKIQKFSKLFSKDYYDSDVFKVEGYNWKIRLFPEGSSTVKGQSLSLFLSLETLSAGSQVYVEYDLTLIRQAGTSFNKKLSFIHWFRCVEDWGSPNFIPLQDLMVPSKGFIVDDVLIVEAKINVISTLNNFP